MKPYAAGLVLVVAFAGCKSSRERNTGESQLGNRCDSDAGCSRKFCYNYQKSKFQKPNREGRGGFIMKRIALLSTFIACLAISVAGQQPSEQRAALNEVAVALDAKSAPALEARLLTQ